MSQAQWTVLGIAGIILVVELASLGGHHPVGQRFVRILQEMFSAPGGL